VVIKSLIGNKSSICALDHRACHVLYFCTISGDSAANGQEALQVFR